MRAQKRLAKLKAVMDRRAQWRQERAALMAEMNVYARIANRQAHASEKNWK